MKQAKYVVRGKFLSFHTNPAYDEKTLDLYKLMNLSNPGSMFAYLRAEFEKNGSIMLHNREFYGSGLHDGVILFLHIPTEERARIDEMLRDKNYDQGKWCRDLYIDWEGSDEFKAFTAKMTSIKEEFSKPKRITLDELIGSGKVLKTFDNPINTDDAEEIQKAIRLIQDSFYIIRLSLIRKKRWFKENWDWSMGIEYISQENIP